MSANNQLNENHGIAATGLQQPHTAVPPTTYNDNAGTHNPSETNRHAGTGIPPVNTARHVEHNINKEREAQNVNLDDTTARIGRNAYPPTTGNITNEPVKSYQETEAITGNHPTTSTGPSVVPQTGATNVHPTAGVHDNKVHPNTGVHDNKIHHEAAGVTGQHPTTSAGVEATKPSAGDKIKGNLEKLAGKITGNEAKVIKGENIAHGRA